jgi:hypothetical protein
VHVFQRAVFPLDAGTISVPPAQLTYALPLSSGFFSREESYTARSEGVRLVALAPPTAGRPADWTGAVGQLRATARLASPSARVGDPLVLTLRVTGVGNVKLLPRPTLEIDWAGAVPGTERVQVDSSGPLVRGVKEFDWILTPTREGRVTLPPIAYDFFDPYKAAYDVATTVPVELEVRTGSLAVADIGESAALLPLRESSNERTIGALVQRGLPLSSRSALFAALAVALVAPLPALALMIRGRRVNVLATAAPVPVTVDVLRKLTDAEADAGESARSARRALHSALASRLGVPPQQLTSRRQVRRMLRRRGVTRETTDRVIGLLEDLDSYGFAGEGAPASKQAFAQRVRESYASIDAEALGDGRPLRSRLGAMFGTTLLLCALGLPVESSDAQAVEVRVSDTSSQSASLSSLAPAVHEATALYERRLFKDAADRFRDLVQARPRDVDLLANWGTAAWSAGDTVTAVIAWQRAARLQPLAGDLQDRIGLLPAGARGGIADVPTIPVPMLQGLALLLWIAGWALAAWLALRRPPSAVARSPRRAFAHATAWLLLLLGSAAGGLAWWGRRELDASRLAVVVRPETMHIAPGTDADAMGGVATGDVVARLEEQGGWQRVEHADGRTGWLPSLRLVAIVTDARPRRAPGAVPTVVPVESLAR